MLDLPPLDIDLPALGTLDFDLPPLDIGPGSEPQLRIATAIKGERDWFTVPWQEIQARMGLEPRTLPGVRTAAGHPAAQLAPPSHKAFPRQAGRSSTAPYPYRVHRSHLPVLGYSPHAPILDWMDEQILAAGEHAYAKVLRPHQIRGVRFIQERRGTLLADEMRVGKTPILAYAHEPDAGVMVVVGPVAARVVHHEWAARRFGACLDVWDGKACSICDRVGAAPADRPSFASLAGRTPNLELLRRKAHVLFLTYATVDPWSDQFLSFGRVGTLACDEAHTAGIQNRRSTTIGGVRKLNTVAERTVMASGTPLWNNVSGLYSIIDTICPSSFGDYWTAMIRYASAKPGSHGWTVGEPSNERELEQRLGAVMLRRTWNDIQGDLPPINRAVEYIELTDADHASVYELANEARKAVGVNKPQTVVGNLERLRKLYAKYKIPKAVEIIRQTMADGHNVVAWTHHRDVARELAAYFEGDIRIFGPIHRGLSAGAREQILEEVRDYNQPRCLIATMGTLATAVSLNWASHEVTVELDWTPAVHQQAEMRPYDGTRAISNVILVADCDTDRRQVDALLAKLGTQQVLGLRAGSGDVSDVLASTLRVDAGRSLDAVASLILEGETL